jgi:hypothetical protein
MVIAFVRGADGWRVQAATVWIGNLPVGPGGCCPTYPRAHSAPSAPGGYPSFRGRTPSRRTTGFRRARTPLTSNRTAVTGRADPPAHRAAHLLGKHSTRRSRGGRSPHRLKAKLPASGRLSSTAAAARTSSDRRFLSVRARPLPGVQVRDGGPVECGGWTPLWMFGCPPSKGADLLLSSLAGHGAALDVAQPNIQSSVQPPHSKNRSTNSLQLLGAPGGNGWRPTARSRPGPLATSDPEAAGPRAHV